MKTRLSQILLVIGALIAFLPIVAVDYVLDSYVRSKESERLTQDIQSITNETQRAAYQGLNALRDILRDSPSLCTPTFVQNVRTKLRSDIYLKQVLVENGDGVQYCDGYEQFMAYVQLSEGLTIPGVDETLSVVQIDGEPVPSLRIASAVGNGRFISAFVEISPHLQDGIPDELNAVSGLRMRLTDGTDILSYGDPLPERHDGRYIVGHALADALPVLTEAVLPFDVIRADYADVDIFITFVAALMGAAFMILAFHYVRRSNLQVIDLERAIDSGELKPYYQPVMDLTTGQITGCEVLIRWEKKGGKVVPPNVFIDYAEATGLAIPMTIRLMEQVRTELTAISRDIPSLKIGINLFEGHFRDTSIIGDIQAIFEGSAISYDQLVFEITERRPLEDQLATTSVIGGLQALGCRLAIDDAGTGHSNLHYIQTLGVDIIKIDRIFVSMVDEDTDQLPVLDGLITMAQGMGAEVIAEGVETEAQALYLRERGVVSAQGFLFAPALKVAPFEKLTRALHKHSAPAPKGVAAGADNLEESTGDRDALVAEKDAVA